MIRNSQPPSTASTHRSVAAARGAALSCRGWEQEGALRCLLNNLDPEVAEQPEDLVVYGGRGKIDLLTASYQAALAALDDPHGPAAIGLIGNIAEVAPRLLRDQVHFDVVTDQTAAHDLRRGYIPIGYTPRQAAAADRDEHAYGAVGAGRLQPTTSLEQAVRDTSLVLETVPEVLALKQELLRRVEDACPPTTLIGTNTSSLSLEQLAGGLARPALFVGVHWFNPAHLIPLVEVVPTAQTDGAAIERIVASLVKIGKRPLVLWRAVPGFVATRLQYALIREALQLVEEGIVTPEQVDLALTECLGLRWAVVGPMRTTDLAGISTAIAVASALYPTLAANTAPQQVLLAHGAGHTTFYGAATMDEAIRVRDEGLARILALRSEGVLTDVSGLAACVVTH